MMKLKAYLVCALLLLTISACGDMKSSSSCERLLPKSLYADRNKIFQLDIPSHINSFKLDDVIFVIVDNNSNTPIEIAPDKDLKVYMWESNTWSPAENHVDYLSVIQRISPKTSDDPGMGGYEVSLAFAKQIDPVRVCIILEAIADPDGSRTKVAAFTETTLTP